MTRFDRIPPERGLPESRLRLHEEHLAREIAGDAGLVTEGEVVARPTAPAGGAETDRPPASRRRLVLALAACLLLAMSGAAIASVAFEFQPDPEDVAGILAEAEEAGRDAVKTDGWRPTLRTEQVWCAYEDGTVGSTRSLDFALDDGMTEEHLVGACVDGPDEARARGVEAPDEFTVCEASAPPEEVESRLETPGFGTLVRGEITDDRPGFPVVLGWSADCAGTTLDTNNPAVELRAPGSFDALNRAREVEIGLTAATLDGCLREHDAELMAGEAARQLPGDWPVVRSGESRGECSRVWVDPHLGVLLVGSQQ